jgi:hypothetical protein
MKILHGDNFHGASHRLSRLDCVAACSGWCARKVVTVPFRALKHALSLLAALTLAAQLGMAQTPQRAAEPADERATPSRAADESQARQKIPGSSLQAVYSLEQKIEQIAASGQIQQIGESSSSRLNPALPLAPGAPPILAFRYLDGQARHRFGDLDLVMDDAGH